MSFSGSEGLKADGMSCGGRGGETQAFNWLSSQYNTVREVQVGWRWALLSIQLQAQGRTQREEQGGGFLVGHGVGELLLGDQYWTSPGEFISEMLQGRSRAGPGCWQGLSTRTCHHQT